MRNLKLILLFTALAVLSWGLYGPVLQHGQVAMGTALQPASLRALICVGIAYFVMAVIVPRVPLRSRRDPGLWTVAGAAWSLAAGVAGTLGALGILLAFKFRGSPVYVMPLVFGLVPVISTLVAMWLGRTYRQASLLFYSGIAVVAVGAAGVLLFAPIPANIRIEHAGNGSIKVALIQEEEGVKRTTEWTAADLHELESDPKLAQAYKLYLRRESLTPKQFLMIPVALALAAFGWGCYGPLLDKGQSRMANSRLRPLACVGLAYLVIGVLAPLPLLKTFVEPGGWTAAGVVWSLAGGAAGAIGALAFIAACHSGGRPAWVTPLVFGGAPVVNTVTMIAAGGTYHEVSPPFYASLIAVIAGAVTVLVFAPRPLPYAPPPEPAGTPCGDDQDTIRSTPKDASHPGEGAEGTDDDTREETLPPAGWQP